MLERDGELVRVDIELFGEKFEELLKRGLQVAVLVERVDQRRDDLPVAQGQVEQGELCIQMIPQRAGGDLLRQERLVVVLVRARRGTPVAVAADQEIGGLHRALVGRVRGLLGRRRSHRHEEVPRRAGRLLVVGLLEQRILLQKPLDLGVQLQRRELQQPDGLLQLWRQREMLA